VSLEMGTTIDQLYPDIWQEVFKYFNALELFSSLMHITKEADDVLFNRNHHLHLRGLVFDLHAQTLPEKLLLSKVLSLELHQESCFHNIHQCLGLRSLKLIGQPQWIIHLIRKLAHIDMKLEQVTLIIPGIGLLHKFIASVSLLPSLRRLEIRGDELEEKIELDTSLSVPTQIERFALHSSSPVDWIDLSRLLPALSNIRCLDITLLHLRGNPPCSCVFPQLRSLSLILIEVPFDCLIRLITMIPSLVRLCLNGLVDSEGFVMNNQWLDLFKCCSSLLKIIVSLSLEEDINCCFNELTRVTLSELSLNLRRNDDDWALDTNIGGQCRWWNLSGIIVKHKEHVKGKN
jgi:hypothetical protein